jgi:hypothetical protein
MQQRNTQHCSSRQGRADHLTILLCFPISNVICKCPYLSDLEFSVGVSWKRILGKGVEGSHMRFNQKSLMNKVPVIHSDYRARANQIIIPSVTVNPVVSTEKLSRVIRRIHKPGVTPYLQVQQTTRRCPALTQRISPRHLHPHA